MYILLVITITIKLLSFIDDSEKGAMMLLENGFVYTNLRYY